MSCSLANFGWCGLILTQSATPLARKHLLAASHVVPSEADDGCLIGQVGLTGASPHHFRLRGRAHEKLLALPAQAHFGFHLAILGSACALLLPLYYAYRSACR